MNLAPAPKAPAQEVMCIGSAIVDIFIHSDQFLMRTEGDQQYVCQAYGGKLEVDRFQFMTGGGGSNTAVGFARRGYRVSLVTETGKDVWSEVILKELRQELVETRWIKVEKKEETGGSVLLVGRDGDRTAMVHRGAASMLDPGDLPITEIKKQKWIHLSSISGRSDTLRVLFEVLKKAGQTRPQLSWNPGQKELELLQRGELLISDTVCDVLLLNKEEWQSVVSLQSQLHQHCQYVVVTDGDQGGQVWHQGELLHQYPIISVTAVDQTGAGDAFAVGLVDGLLRGLEVAAACDMGRQNAASVVQQFGAKPGLLTS